MDIELLREHRENASVSVMSLLVCDGLQETGEAGIPAIYISKNAGRTLGYPVLVYAVRRIPGDTFALVQCIQNQVLLVAAPTPTRCRHRKLQVGESAADKDADINGVSLRHQLERVTIGPTDAIS